MISSRWPRPIGISASIALRPVAIGSCTDLRGMMPGALTSTRRALVGLDRALAVDRIAERVDHAAEQALADRHVDDGAGALDGLAFLDLAVGAEDHDADVVGFEVERHAAHAVLELDHLAGLHVVEAVDAGDAVADRQHLADLGDLGLLAEILDLLFQDGGNFCGADIHQRASFIASLIALSLVRSELSTMRLPTLTISPPMMAGSTLTSRSMSLPPVTDLSALFERVEILVVELLGDGDLRGDLALVAGDQRAEGADHVAHREQPAVGGDRRAGNWRRGPLMPALSSIAASAFSCSSAPNTGLRTRRSRSGLSAISASNGSRSALTASIALLLARELEQRVGVAAGHAGDDGVFACHRDARLFTSFTGRAPSRRRRRKLLESKRNSDFAGTSRVAAETPVKSRG